MSELNNIALQIISNGKGILAADESTGTMTKRLESVGLESSEKNRLSFRKTLFTASNMSNCIGGVILYDETINQEVNKKKIPEIISDQGTYPGIKVDTGAKVLAGSENEKITEGLDGLRERLKVYNNLGAKFTKWRGVYFISKEYPSKLAVYSNAHALARYAALVQEANMVPILNKVDLTGIILKPNMILAGSNSKDKISGEEVAKLTVECLKNSVPQDVPGVAFLSGGQSEIEATENLNLINKYNTTNFIMTYSYGRALQQSALKHWSKNIKDIKGTQKIFNHRAEMCSLASQGKWSNELENK